MLWLELCHVKNRWAYVAESYDGMLLSNKKGQAIDTHHSGNQSQNHYEWKKARLKKSTCFYDFLYIKSRKSMWICSDWKQISGCLGTGQRKGWITKGKQEAFGAIGNGYLDYTDSFMSVHIRQNWPNCTLQMSVI